MLNKNWAFETLILHLNLLPANYKLRRWKHAILFVKATKMLCSPGDHKQWWSTQCRIGSPSISKWRMDSRIPITTAKAASELSMQIAQIYEGNDCSRVQWWCVVGFGNFNLLNARSRCSIILQYTVTYHLYLLLPIQSSLAIWHCWVTTLRGPFRLSFLGTRHVGYVNHKFSDDTYVGWWRTDRTDLTYIDLRRCLLFIIFKRCSPSPVLASPVIFSFGLWISCCSCRVLRFLSFANLGRTPPRVGQIFFLVMLFDCKMWMEKLCSWSQEGFMS